MSGLLDHVEKQNSVYQGQKQNFATKKKSNTRILLFLCLDSSPHLQTSHIYKFCYACVSNLKNLFYSFRTQG